MIVKAIIASYLSLTLSLMTPIILTTPSNIIIIPKNVAQVETIVQAVPETRPAAPTPARPVPTQPSLRVADQTSSSVPFQSVVLPAQAKQALDADAMRTMVNNYLQWQEGEFGVYYYDLSSGERFGINEQDIFFAASTYKIPVCLYLYTLIDSGKIKPTELVPYLAKDWEDGSGFIQYSAVGEQYTVADLADRALTDSDNIALNMLVRRLGSRDIMAFCKRVGAPVVSAGEGETSAQSMGVYLRELYRFSQESKWGQLMVEQMTKSSVKDRIPALLPANVKVANKHGNYHGVINDAAIVYDKRPYVLVILSRNVPYFDAPDVLAQVSKSIYDVR